MVDQNSSLHACIQPALRYIQEKGPKSSSILSVFKVLSLCFDQFECIATSGTIGISDYTYK